MNGRDASVDGPVAVIIGAGGALGSASALALAKRGMRCVLAGPTESSLRRAAASIAAARGEATTVCADAGEEQGAKLIFDHGRARFGPCDVLVHSAAIQGPTAPLSEITLAQWEAVMRVNLGSVFLCAREALREMVPRGRGSIIFVSSSDALRGFPMTGPYAASKSALTGFARALAAEAGGAGVRVNVLSPGPMPEASIYQEAVSGIAARLGVGADELLGQVTGAQRAYSAAEIASGTVFLASEDSSPMTGQSLVMDSLLTQV
ncbi:MAG TPA: SDR family oxidoreductase [Solirubrobacteraceae bacterium]|jgi:NAD(P)-dependent dehydrogenase (short-subunit alcohol dehydrogenase family)